MSTRVDIEDLRTTKTEKLLAAVLAAFLLMGLVWTYQEIDDWMKDDRPVYFAPPTPPPEVAERDRARERFEEAQSRARRARAELELRREAYRTALDANQPAAALERRYLAAQRTYERAVRQREDAARKLQALEPAAQTAQQRSFREAESERRREERNIIFARIALCLLALAVAFLLLWQLHRRASRYLTLAFAAVVSATILAFVLTADYVTDYFDPLDLGPLVLSAIGATLTIVSFYLLQRYLARRLPRRRVRKRLCPFCGYPSRGNQSCEGCGRGLVAACSRCGADRRVGVRYCGACGAM